MIPYANGVSGSCTATTCPHGSHDLESTESIRVPQQYLDLEAASSVYTTEMMLWDYALVTFTLPPAPVEDVGGGMGMFLNHPATGTLYVYGYPTVSCSNFAFPHLCGANGTGYLTQNGAWIETDNIDLTGGNSGGPWQVSYSGARWVAGVHIAERTFWDFGMCGFDVCRRNDARRIDSGVFSFIQANSVDY